MFIVSAAALLGRKGSFLLCGYSWFLCGCWCCAEVFFFYPCGIILTLRGETSWIQDVVFHGCWALCAFRFVFANKPGTDCPLRSSFLCLCVAHIATACELKLQEHSKAPVNSSSVELRGAACTCDKLEAAPKAFSLKGRGRVSSLGLGCKEAMLQIYWDDDSCLVTFLQTCPT